MTRLTLVCLALISILLSSTLASKKHSIEQLGIEITTNSCSEVLYLPVGLTRQKGLVATVPIRDGGNVSAVRIVPVMEAGKIRFDAILLTGNFSETPPRHGLNQLHPLKIVSRLAAAGETRIVNDDTNNSSWSVTIRAVPLREPVAAFKEKMGFVRASAQDDDKSCGCAYCHDLRVCPNRGSCIDTTCGSICCPNGEEEIGATPQSPSLLARMTEHIFRAYTF
ncbi:MAG TPA: hypothetical protein VI306_07185 [Pyrinomonadaceae bacterium]